MTAALRILYVDDEPGLLDIGKLFLEESGDFTVTTALSADEGIHLLEQEKFDALISDYQMPGMDGIQFLVEVRTRFGLIPFILFTGRGREEVVIQALNSGADFYLQKGGEPVAQFAELSHKVKAAASRKKADDALRRSEKRYRHLIEHSNEAIVVAQEGMLKLVNHKTIEFTGYSEQELLSMQFSVFIHPEDRAMVVERYQKRIKGEEGPSRYAFRLSSKDGSIKWVELSVVVIDWDGRPATLNFLTDITERKRADDSLREEQQFTKLMLNSLPGIFYLYTYPENRMVRWNKQHETLLGYTAEEIKGKLGTDLHLPEYKDAVLKAIDVVMEKGQNSVESTLMAKDGHQIPFFFTGVRFETPDQLYFMGIGIDITERKVAEEALRKSEEKFRKAFFTSPDSICITRLSDGMFVSINKGFTEITGYTEEDVAGKTSLEINVWKDQEDRRKIVEELKAKGEVRNYEARFLTKTGEITGLMSTSIIELNGVPHILNITHDITERKVAEEALLKKTEELHASYEQLAASEEELRQNLDDLSRAERVLRESEEKFHSLYLHMNEGAALHKLTYNDQGIPEDYIIIETNPAFERQLGISRDAIIGKTSREAYGVAEPPFLEIYARVALTGKPEIFETCFPPLAKHFSISAYCPGKGRFATIFEDITERKQAEKELLRKNEELHASF